MSALTGLLDALLGTLRRERADPCLVAERVRSILEYLSGSENGRDQNCVLVDEFVCLRILEDPAVARGMEQLPAELVRIIEDMGTCLHDACKAPAVARNFRSTPEQLLQRLRRWLSSP